MGEKRTYDGIVYEVGDVVVVTGPILYSGGETRDDSDTVAPLGTEGVVVEFDDDFDFGSNIGGVCVDLATGHVTADLWWFKPGFNIRLKGPPVIACPAWTPKRRLLSL